MVVVGVVGVVVGLVEVGVVGIVVLGLLQVVSIRVSMGVMGDRCMWCFLGELYDCLQVVVQGLD